jgi:acylphosphatase
MMTESGKSRMHAIVEGRVQGVGFRYFVLDAANDLGLSGWVRNRYDQTVEVTAEGNREDLEKLLIALRKGPRGSMVTDVKPEWLAALGEFSRFSVRSTY